MRAWPRLLREVCANGSLVCAGEFEAHEGMAAIGEAVERFLTLEHYQPAVQALRQTRETHVEDPGAYLDEFQRIPDHMALVYSYRERITARFRSEGDESAYGVVNAITATARDVDDWGDRLDLEELAGRIAWLRRPVPTRSGGGVLLPT